MNHNTPDVNSQVLSMETKAKISGTTIPITTRPLGHVKVVQG